MNQKFMAVMNGVGCICAGLLSYAHHSSGNGEAAIAWGVVTMLGFGNFCGNLGDYLERKGA